MGKEQSPQQKIMEKVIGKVYKWGKYINACKRIKSDP